MPSASSGSSGAVVIRGGLKRVAALALFFLAPLSAVAGVSFSLDPTSVEPGQRTRLEIRLPADDVGIKDTEDEIELPVLYDDLITESKKLQLLSRDFRREHDTLIWTFELAAYERGKHTVPPVEIRHGAMTFSTEAASLEVVSTRDPRDKALRDDFGPAKAPLPWQQWVLMALACLAAAGALEFLRRRLTASIARRRRQAASTTEGAGLGEAPETWLRRELARLTGELEEAKGDRDRVGRVIDGFTHVVRRYLTLVSGAPAEAWTTREMADNFTGQKPAEGVVPVLKRCDEWRFRTVTSNDGADLAAASLDETRKVLLP